jgi:hypothetical protein
MLRRAGLTLCADGAAGADDGGHRNRRPASLDDLVGWLA